jgi:UrcA family protein
MVSGGNIMAISGKLLGGVVVSVISLACAAAYADSPRSSTVHYRDLNLDRPQDVARLYNRITVAADRVCGPRSLTGSYYKTADYESCYADAIAQAVANVDHASVTSYYRQRWAEPVSKATVARQ